MSLDSNPRPVDRKNVQPKYLLIIQDEETPKLKYIAVRQMHVDGSFVDVTGNLLNKSQASEFRKSSIEVGECPSINWKVPIGRVVKAENVNTKRS